MALRAAWSQHGDSYRRDGRLTYVRGGRVPTRTSTTPSTRHAAHSARGPVGLLAFAALGVVYGDIGTSPLYAFLESFHGLHAIAPTATDIIGVLALIFCALVIVITIKYITFILRADNRGEGGILALTALATPIRRYGRSRRRWLVLIGVFGAALLANLKYNGVLHERVSLTTITSVDLPYIADADRLTVEPLGHGLYQGTIRYGFMEEPDVRRALAPLAQPPFGLDLDRVPYFVNRTRVIASKLPGMALWREHLYRLMRHNAASPADYFRLPRVRVFEISTSVEV